MYQVLFKKKMKNNTSNVDKWSTKYPLNPSKIQSTQSDFNKEGLPFFYKYKKFFVAK